MSEAIVRNRNTIRIYACGGCGTNIASGLKNVLQNQDGYALVDVAFVDASDSNVAHLNISGNNNVYLVEGLNGSGKRRSENHKLIAARVNEIIQAHRPGDINIVISSGGGGSGSVIAPAIAHELLNRDIPVLGIIVGDTHTKIDMKNTINTLKTYDKVVETSEKTLSLIYAQNDDDAHRSQINMFIMSAIHALTILFSGQNGELDEKDIFNFLRPERITGVDPTLALFSITQGDGRNIRPNSVLSICTLAQNDQYPALPFKPELHYLGLINSSVQPQDLTTLPFHFLLSEGFFHDRLQMLEKEIGTIQESVNARVKHGSLSKNSEGDGIFVFD